MEASTQFSGNPASALRFASSIMLALAVRKVAGAEIARLGTAVFMMNRFTVATVAGLFVGPVSCSHASGKVITPYRKAQCVLSKRSYAAWTWKLNATAIGSATVRVLGLDPEVIASAAVKLVKIVPRAFVVGFVATRVIPSVRVVGPRVSHSFADFVAANDGQHVGNSQGTQLATGTIWVGEYGVLDLVTVVSKVAVVAAETAARRSAGQYHLHT